MSPDLFVVIISQYMCISSHHVVYLKLTPCCMSVISQSWKNIDNVTISDLLRAKRSSKTLSISPCLWISEIIRSDTMCD